MDVAEWNSVLRVGKAEIFLAAERKTSLVEYEIAIRAFSAMNRSFSLECFSAAKLRKLSKSFANVWNRRLISKRKRSKKEDLSE